MNLWQGHVQNLLVHFWQLWAVNIIYWLISSVVYPETKSYAVFICHVCIEEDYRLHVKKTFKSLQATCNVNLLLGLVAWIQRRYSHILTHIQNILSLEVFFEDTITAQSSHWGICFVNSFLGIRHMHLDQVFYKNHFASRQCIWIKCFAWTL